MFSAATPHLSLTRTASESCSEVAVVPARTVFSPSLLMKLMLSTSTYGFSSGRELHARDNVAKRDHGQQTDEGRTGQLAVPTADARFWVCRAAPARRLRVK
jgi:hypothetical protein